QKSTNARRKWSDHKTVYHPRSPFGSAQGRLRYTKEKPPISGTNIRWTAIRLVAAPLGLGFYTDSYLFPWHSVLSLREWHLFFPRLAASGNFLDRRERLRCSRIGK